MLYDYIYMTSCTHTLCKSVSTSSAFVRPKPSCMMRFLPKIKREFFFHSCRKSLSRLFRIFCTWNTNILGYFSTQNRISSMIRCFHARPLRSVLVKETAIRKHSSYRRATLYKCIFFYSPFLSLLERGILAFYV